MEIIDTTGNNASITLQDTVSPGGGIRNIPIAFTKPSTPQEAIQGLIDLKLMHREYIKTKSMQLKEALNNRGVDV